MPRATSLPRVDSPSPFLYLVSPAIGAGGISSLLPRLVQMTIAHRGRVRPRKSLGQHFLRDENICGNIAGAIAPSPGDILLEIGPGEGVLTRHLAGRVRQLVLVELDTRLHASLREQFSGPHTDLLQADILTIDLAALATRFGGRLRVAGNIPYNITSPILFHLLDHRAHVADATLMMQREVAQRLVAVPRTKDYGILSVMVQLFADVRLLFDVPPSAFYPTPEVHSSVVHLTMLDRPRHAMIDEDRTRAMVRSVFGKRRKMLRNSLGAFLGGGDLPAGFDLTRRPEELSPDELVALGNALSTPPASSVE